MTDPAPRPIVLSFARITRPSLALGLALALASCSGSTSGGTDGAASVEDGATYPSIQAAIDAAPEGGLVRIGPGTFAEALVIDKPLRLRGAGRGTRIDTVGDPEASSDDSQSTQRAGLTIRNVEGLVLEDMEFSGNPQDGILVRNSSKIVLRGVLVRGNGDDGIDVRDSTDILIEASDTRDSEITDNGDRGVQVRTSRSVRVVGAVVHGNRSDGIRMRESETCSVERCSIESNGSSGVRLRDVRGAAVIDSSIAGNEYGIRTRSVEGLILERNEFGGGNARGNLRREDD